MTLRRSALEHGFVHAVSWIAGGSRGEEPAPDDEGPRIATDLTGTRPG